MGCKKWTTERRHRLTVDMLDSDWQAYRKHAKSLKVSVSNLARSVLHGQVKDFESFRVMMSKRVFR